jgi:hypothetical protein
MTRQNKKGCDSEMNDSEKADLDYYRERAARFEQLLSACIRHRYYDPERVSAWRLKGSLHQTSKIVR